MALYCADCAYLPKSTIDASVPSSTPNGISNGARPVSRPTTTRTASTATPLPITIGSALGSDLRMIPATMRICLSRPADAGSASAFFAALFDACAAAPPGFFTMGVRIRACRARRETRSSCCHVQPVRGRPVEPASAVGRADQRPRHDPGEPEPESLLAKLGELLGRDPALDRVVPGRGPQVLGDGQQVAPGRAQVRHGRGDLLRPLAHTQNEVRLRDETRALGRLEHGDR